MSKNYKRKKRITFKSTEPVFGWAHYNKLKKEAAERDIKNRQFVYLIKSESGLFKIGISADPRSRLSQIISASGFGAELVAFYKTNEPAHLVEKKLHGLFAPYRVRGEWFDFPDTYSLEKFETVCDRFGMTPQPLSVIDGELLVGQEVIDKSKEKEKRESWIEWTTRMNKEWEESKKKDGT